MKPRPLLYLSGRAPTCTFLYLALSFRARFWKHSNRSNDGRSDNSRQSRNHNLPQTSTRSRMRPHNARSDEEGLTFEILIERLINLYQLLDSVQHLGPRWSYRNLRWPLQNQEPLMEPQLTQPHSRHLSPSLRSLLQLCICRLLRRPLNLSRSPMGELQLSSPCRRVGLDPLLQLQRALHRAASPQDR